jgi:hypothetical protein
MIQIPAQAKIFVFPELIMSIESLDAVIVICKKNGFDPFSGDIFVFRGEDSTYLGLLSYDGHGFQWCVKRFSEGKLAWWPNESEIVQILPRDLQIMLWGGNPNKTELPKMWKPIHNIKKHQ